MKVKDRSNRSKSFKRVKVNKMSYSLIQSKIRKLFEMGDNSLHLRHLILRAAVIKPLETLNWLGRLYKELNKKQIKYYYDEIFSV